MKNIATILSLFLCSTFGFAQLAGQPQNYSASGNQTEALYQYALGTIDESNKKTNFVDETIEGSPYLSNDFAATTLFYGDENQGTIYYRYNAYNEELEIKEQNLESEPIRALSKDKRIKILVKGRPMSFKTFTSKKGFTKNGYLTLLRDGNYKLYHHLGVTFKDVKKAANSFDKGRPARFNQFDEYYLENKSGKKLGEVEFSNSKILDMIEGSERDAAASFLKKNKIKIKSITELYRFVDHLNGL